LETALLLGGVSLAGMGSRGANPGIIPHAKRALFLVLIILRADPFVDVTTLEPQALKTLVRISPHLTVVGISEITYSRGLRRVHASGTTRGKTLSRL
jgi:hypothetical protein